MTRQLFAFNSLLRPENSLFPDLSSLLTRLGKCLKSGCGAAVYGSAIVSRSPEIANFPLNFPVSREFELETGSYLTASATTHSHPLQSVETSRGKPAELRRFRQQGARISLWRSRFVGIFGLVSGRENSGPGNCGLLGRDRVKNCWNASGEAEHFALLSPFDRAVAEGFDTDAAR